MRSSKSLAPKVRRPGSRRGLIAAAPAEAAPLPVHHTTRVLVALRPGSEPPRLPQVRWIPIVDGFYLAEVPISGLADLAEASEVQYVQGPRTLSPLLLPRPR